MAHNNRVYDQWQGFLYETAEKLVEALSERDFFFEAKNFLADYSSETQHFCWQRAVIESEAEEANDFDGCPEFPIPPSFYDYARTEIRRLTQIRELGDNGARKSATELRHEREQRQSLSDLAFEMRQQRLLQQTPESGPETKAKGKAKKDEGELTVEQAAIFFHYFFEVAKVSPNLAAAKRIDVIKSVTRWSRNSIANIVYDKKGGGVFGKANGDDYFGFEADMVTVKSLYKKLELQDVVALIEAEIEDIGGSL